MNKKNWLIEHKARNLRLKVSVPRAFGTANFIRRSQPLFFFLVFFFVLNLIVVSPTSGQMQDKGSRPKVKSYSKSLFDDRPIIKEKETMPVLVNEAVNVGAAKGPQLSSTIFFRWQKFTANGTVPNNFDIDRAYIDLKDKLDGGAVARLTLDAARISGITRQNLFDFLKYAYVELPLSLTKLGVVPFTMSAKLGLQQTIWIDWAEKRLNLRYIAKTLVDNEGVMPSSDFGAGVGGRFTLGKLPEIEYQALILNGQGFATSEVDSNKAISLRFNSDIYETDKSKISIGVFANSESASGSVGNPNSQFGIGVGVVNYTFNTYLEYLAGAKSDKNINGYSLGATLGLNAFNKVLKGLSVFARCDNYNPDTSASGNLRIKSFYGVTYDWSRDVKLALDMQNARVGDGATTSALYVHTLIQL
jgi:hypothetical protein